MDSTRLPRHIAIIMDGNGRWAKERGLPRAEGHRRGSETIETIVEAATGIGIRYLTLYAFSEENWSRPSEEVTSLMRLLRYYLASKRQKMMDEGVRFETIGDLKLLSPDLREEIRNTKEATRNGSKTTLIVALSYGARQEMCRAANKLISEHCGVIASEAKQSPGTSGIASSPTAPRNDGLVDNITPDVFSRALDTAGIPDPDLLIRTGGEYRISNFLLWQLAYTELYFTETLWPDFNRDEFIRAIEEYQKRERRFGLISEQLEHSPPL